MTYDTQAAPAAESPTETATIGAGDATGLVALTDTTFDAAVTASSGIVLVDFGADRCGPCRMMKPVVARLAQRYRGRATIATLDVDANPEITARYAVRSIPAFLFFQDGQLVAGVGGAVAESRLAAQLEALLSGDATDAPAPA